MKKEDKYSENEPEELPTSREVLVDLLQIFDKVIEELEQTRPVRSDEIQNELFEIEVSAIDSLAQLYQHLEEKDILDQLSDETYGKLQRRIDTARSLFNIGDFL